MRYAFVLLALSITACSAPPVEQASCAFGTLRECFDGRDNSHRANRDDLADRTKGRDISLLDATNRANRDDLANRTMGPPQSLLDVTARANREDLTDRTRIRAVSDADISNRRNRDDTRDGTLVCP